MVWSNRHCGAYPRCWVSKFCSMNVWGVDMGCVHSRGEDWCKVGSDRYQFLFVKIIK
jgi:hypothetical protein